MVGGLGTTRGAEGVRERTSLAGVREGIEEGIIKSIPLFGQGQGRGEIVCDLLDTPYQSRHPLPILSPQGCSGAGFVNVPAPSPLPIIDGACS